jgi:FtsZ-interacting cell division protein YlmF
MGYRAGDLKNLIEPIFEVDTYASKMGDDSDIVVVSFSVKENQAAKDLVDFIEKGYSFVLDADSTTGEIDTGMYKVFVEMERQRDVAQNILELLDGVGKIAEMDDFKFRYHKSFRSKVANEQTLGETIPVDPQSYNEEISESRVDNFKDFFSKSFLEGIEVFGDNLILKKAFADPIGFVIKDFDDAYTINESITQKININDYPEIMFLTKYIGDYNIMKYGSKTITMESQGHTLVVERL